MRPKLSKSSNFLIFVVFNSCFDPRILYVIEEITTFGLDINPIINPLPNTDGSYVEQRIWDNGDNCTRIEELKVIGGS